MIPTQICPDCGTALAADAHRGICPTCLLKAALEPPPPGDETIHLVLPDGKTEPLPFHEIGDYELLEQIGHGGMGLIFKARQRSLDRLVALKLIRRGSLARGEDLARFRTEAAAAARLIHPHIVSVYEIGEHEGQPYYTMEFVPGRSLAEALNDGPFQPRRAAEFARLVANAIQFAHEREILHRDLKPSNILIDANEEPRVADFGLAKIITDDSELTLSGAIIGSPGYMPPEQASGRGAEATVQSDVYSLGAILYEMLTGRPPFAAATAIETIKLVVEQDPPPPRTLNPLLPRDLETICLKCLNKERWRRYGSARELSDELGRFLNDEPVLARPTGLPERAWRWCRRNQTLAALAVVLALAPAVIISLLVVKDSQIAQQRNRAVAQERKMAENLYAEDITLALDALERNDYGLAWRSLAAHVPTDTNAIESNDLRGFEWRWLWDKVRGDATKIFSKHTREVSSVSWSPDGRYVVSSSSDGTARLWDAGRMSLARTYTNPLLTSDEKGTNTSADVAFATSYGVNSASFSADSRQLLIGMTTGLEMWDLSTDRQLMTLKTNHQTAALFSPVDPNLALTYPLYPRTSIGILDTRAGALTHFYSSNRADAVCFAPDGKSFARWDRVARQLVLQSVADGETLASIETKDIYVIHLAFSPDGGLIAAASITGPKIDLFDVKTQKLCGELHAPNGRILAVAISPDGKLLASGGFDQVIRLWDFANRKEIRALRGHRAVVSSLAFSPDSRKLVSGSFDGTVRLWDVEAPAQPPGITNAHGPFVISSDNRFLVTQGTNGFARLWNLADARLLNEWRAPQFQSAAMFSNGSLLTVTLGSSNRPAVLSLIDPANGNMQTKIPLVGIDSACAAVELSPDGALAATGHADGSVATWDASSGKLLHAARHVFDSANRLWAVDTLAFSANGHSLFAATSAHVNMKMWSVAELREIGGTDLGAAYPIRCAVAPDGSQVATAGTGQRLAVNLWNEHMRGPIIRLRGEADYLDAIAYAPDGRMLVAASMDGQMRLWNLPTDRELGILMTLPPATRFDHVAFSRDGTWFGTDDTSGAFHLFHAPPPAED